MSCDSRIGPMRPSRAPAHSAAILLVPYRLSVRGVMTIEATLTTLSTIRPSHESRYIDASPRKRGTPKRTYHRRARQRRYLLLQLAVESKGTRRSATTQYSGSENALNGRHCGNSVAAFPASQAVAETGSPRCPTSSGAKLPDHRAFDGPTPTATKWLQRNTELASEPTVYDHLHFSNGSTSFVVVEYEKSFSN
jgi:hypothetical protein